MRPIDLVCSCGTVGQMVEVVETTRRGVFEIPELRSCPCKNDHIAYFKAREAAIEKKLKAMREARRKRNTWLTGSKGGPLVPIAEVLEGAQGVL